MKYNYINQIFIMDKIHQNLENIEKYLMVAQLENTKMNDGNKSAGTRLRSSLQNISKECAEARRLSLEAKHIGKAANDAFPQILLKEGTAQLLPPSELVTSKQTQEPKTRRRKPSVKPSPVLHPSPQLVVT